MVETAYAEAPTVTGSVPLYTDARPVAMDTHGKRAVRTGGEAFGFAARAPLVPLTVDEFERAALDYPIVFVGPERRAFAVTGLDADRNLFVGEDGSYAKGSYIPAYLRRYPFVFARSETGDLRVLCLDDASERVVPVSKKDDAVLPLFADGQPTALTRNALDFCQQFEAAEQRTANLVALLDELGLFEDRFANRRTKDAKPDEAPELLLSYLSINREKLAGLSGEGIVKLHKAGAAPAVYAQIFSQVQWEALSIRS